MVDWIMYGKIQEMKRTGLNKSQTSRHLGIDYKTVLKYWDMSPDEYSATRKVNRYRHSINSILTSLCFSIKSTPTAGIPQKT